MNGPDGKKFVWGKVRRIHSIDCPTVGKDGRIVLSEKVNVYDIVEYVVKDGQVAFHPYVNGKDTHWSFLSMEGAILHAIGAVYGGPDAESCGRFAMKVLGVPT